MDIAWNVRDTHILCNAYVYLDNNNVLLDSILVVLQKMDILDSINSYHGYDFRTMAKCDCDKQTKCQ